MNINCVSSSLVSFFKDNLLSLPTDQQKRIQIVAAAAFATLALLCLTLYFCCWGKKVKPTDSASSVKTTPSPKAPTIISEALPKVEKSKDEHPVESGGNTSAKDQPFVDPPKKSSNTVSTKQTEVSTEMKTIPSGPQAVQPNPTEQPKIVEEKEEEATPNPIHLEIPQEDEKPLPYHPIDLLPFGRARIGVDGGALPDFMGLLSIDGIHTCSMKKLWAGAFTCCFHTTESQKEILNALIDIGTKHDPYRGPKGMFTAFEGEKRPRGNWLNFMYNNLVRLHDAVPGESKAKKVKIYWSDRLENELFPELFEEKPIQVRQLLFTIVRGEEIDSPFQDLDIDFTQQLQFVGLNKDKIMWELQDEIQRLSEKVLGKNVVEEVSRLIESLAQDDDNLLIKDASRFTALNKLRIRLSALEQENKSIDFDAKDPAGKREYFLACFAE